MSVLLIVVYRRSSADTVNKGHANLSTLPRQRRTGTCCYNLIGCLPCQSQLAPPFAWLLLVDRQRHSSPHLFHASFWASDSRRIHEAGLRFGCRFWLEQLNSVSPLNGLTSTVIGRECGSPSPALKPLRCPFCSPTILFPPWSASAACEERGDDKSRICGKLHTCQGGKYPRNRLARFVSPRRLIPDRKASLKVRDLHYFNPSHRKQFNIPHVSYLSVAG